jgi:hypothetical protein
MPGTLVKPKGQGAQAAAGTGPVLTHETYLGYERARRLASPVGLARNRVRLYPPAPVLRTNQWALSGE